ncbi:MAG: aminomethyl-transferring glycine dehydrogenase subunit GcvPB [Bacteroidales bacterium]|nr:aminomethyl-transferring glycine dehydrogenase subunit GcvPB [Bacteroidales bacterium]
MRYYDHLIFDYSKSGRCGYTLPKAAAPEVSTAVPEGLRRASAPALPEVSEVDVVRHYTNLSQMNFGVDTGFYPLGSCTMKYNPKINEEVAALPAFAAIHPLQPVDTVQGVQAVYAGMEQMLSAITGMAYFTFNPCAGAHGELTGLMIMRAWHRSRGDMGRTKVIVPDSAHGTNPASAAVCGLDVVVVKSNADGLVDVEDLKPLLGPDLAGIMMTNPNTLGLFERDIKQIAALVHEAGGLLYYDGANMNPLIGKVRPGDMGFDIMHLNLHKSFSTPHGGGGPGSGPVGVAEHLVDCLPDIRVSGFHGNFGVILRAYAYILMLGKQNLKKVGQYSVLSANYIKECLKDAYKLPIEGVCKHEFVFDGLINDGAHDDVHGATTLDVAKRLLDFGFHAPTIYFPLLFHQALMIEPTETESKETIDAFIDVMHKIAAEAAEDPTILQEAPHNAPIKRPDETAAARNPILKFKDTL